MTTRENLITALEGGTPEQTPLSIYAWFFTHPQWRYEDWRPLLEQGLGVTHHCATVVLKEHGVTTTVEQRLEGDRRYTITRKETPVGTLQRVTYNSLSAPRLIEWTCEEWIKEPRDYAIRQWIVEHSEPVAQYETFARTEEAAGDNGITVLSGGCGRTPAMSIMVDYAGMERFALDLAAGVEELFALYEAERRLFLEATRLVAAGPGRFVDWTENLTVCMMGPRWYRRLLLPIYQEAVPIMEAGGKRVLVHYDGALRAIADDIAQAPFHGLESLTEPPEGDMWLDECRRAWPDKAFWVNINLHLYDLPPAQLRETIIAMRTRAGKRALAFEISEDVPANWAAAIPVILRTLAELG